jgi:hypothetical protein
MTLTKKHNLGLLRFETVLKYYESKCFFPYVHIIFFSVLCNGIVSKGLKYNFFLFIRKRTPICFTSAEDNKKNSKQFSIIDPRSPTNEYNRTPIHMNVANFTSQNNDLNQSSCESYLNESSLSQESSLLLINESCTNIPTSKQKKHF